MAVAEIKRSQAEGLVPVVVGGTGLYLKSLMAGIADMPSIPTEIRARIRRNLKQEGSASLHERLLRVDPEMANNLSPQDGQRICRALEVFEATGRSLSDWQREETKSRDIEDLAFTTILFRPPRDQLYAACSEGFSHMLENGAIEEVRRLDALGLDPELPAMKALGVPHLLSFVRGNMTLEEVRRLGQQATRRYVKRQTTWFSRQIIADVILKSQYNESCWHKIFPKISNFMLTCRA